MAAEPNPTGKEQFATRMGVIMAVAGSAVGIGNYLRFPGLAVQHGGGAFMLPYFVALLLLGIPLSWAEWTMGRYGGIRGFNSAPGIYSVIWRRPVAKYFGALALMIPLVVYMFYVLVESWCLTYAINYLTGDLMVGSGGRVDQFVAEAQASGLTDQAAVTAAFKAHFNAFIGSNADGAAFDRDNRLALIVLIGVFGMNFACIYRGLSRGIETLCNIGIPVLLLLSFTVLFRVLSLGTPDPAKPDQNLINGLGFMWNPHGEALRNPRAWLDAAGQIFFTLGAGFGIIINYSSYLRRNDDVALSSLTAASINEFSEVCHAGLITIPAAYIFLGAAVLSSGEMSSTFHVGFVALPNVFNAMWGGQFFGFLWYFMLFIAAIAASVSMLQPCIAFLEEGLGLKRHASAAMLGLLAALGCGFVLYFSKDSKALATLDFWVGTLLIFLLATFQTILYGWVFGIDRGHRELHSGANIRIPYVVQYVLKYITPLYLLAIIVAFCWFNLPSSVTPAFVADGSIISELQDGDVPPALVAEFQEAKLPLPEQSAPTRDGDGAWSVRDADGFVLYVLRSITDENGGDALQVSAYNVGSVEEVRREPIAMLSIGFIAVILGFLLLMTRIAGLRWEREGRFAGLDQVADA